MKHGDLVTKWVNSITHAPHGTALRSARCVTAATAIADLSPQAKANQSLVQHWLAYAAVPQRDATARATTAKNEILKLI